MKQSGALPSQLISQISRLGQFYIPQNQLPDQQIKPASYDLRLGEKGWCVKSVFLPQIDKSIDEIIARHSLFEIDIKKPIVITPGSVFIFELLEQCKLDPDLHGLVSPKSSAGRINLWVRTLVDKFPRFDRVPAGYSGKLYAMVTTKNWPVRIKSGDSLTQIRFFKGEDSRLSSFELNLLNKEVGLLYDAQKNRIDDNLNFTDDGILLTADLDNTSNIRDNVVAYQAKKNMNLIDLSKINQHPKEEFFIPIYGNKEKELMLSKGEFYILPSFEYLRVPPQYAAEMIAYDIAAGEFRSHYAGFFDPGWGYGKAGTIYGTPAVLEIIPHEDVILRHRQPVCKMIYRHLLAVPDRLYGNEIKSNYHRQRGPKLAKYFR